MGGVNFTRNRAWWHTVIWDEYGQRHQYLAIFPTFLVLMPMYHYGSSLNRSLEQTFAAKMYLLDYENKRNRLTHDMIMEHFEMHVEKVQDVFDEVSAKGFEKAFEYEFNNPDSGKIVNNIPIPDQDLLGEIDEKSGMTAFVDEIKESLNVPYWVRQQLEASINRRKVPGGFYNNLSKGYVNVRDLPRHFDFNSVEAEKAPEEESDE